MPGRSWPLRDGRTAHLRWTDRGDGDLRVDGDDADLAARRAAVVDVPWTWLRQVHGARVVDVEAPGAVAGAEADAAVTAATGAALAAHTADCVPVGLVAEGGAVGVAHAGWRGLVDGVVPATVEALRRRGEGPVDAVVGPCIGPECYAFGEDDLGTVAARLGAEVASTTSDGRPALDLRQAATTALERAGVDRIHQVDECTACGPTPRWSHRAREDRSRQALVAWIGP